MKGWAVFLFILGALGIGFGISQDDWLLWAGIVCFAIATGLISGLVTFPRKKMMIVQRDDHEFRVLPLRTRAEQLLTFAVPFGIGLAAAAFIVFRRYQRVHALSQEAISLAMMGGICGIALFVHGVRSYRLSRKLAQPRVILKTDSADPKQLNLDKPFRLRVEIDAFVPVKLSECQVAIRCMQHLLLHYGRYVHHDVREKSKQIINRVQAIEMSPDHPLITSSQALLRSSDHLPTGKSGITMYPFYHWEIEVKLSGASSSTTLFPIEIFPSPSTAVGTEAASFE